MIRYQLIWYNYVAQETWFDYILAKDKDDAREIAYMYIKHLVGHDDHFAESSIESLSECCEVDDITREYVEQWYK